MCLPLDFGVCRNEFVWCQLNALTKGVRVPWLLGNERKTSRPDKIAPKRRMKWRKKKLFDVLFWAFMISEFVSRKTCFLRQMWHCFCSTPQIELSVWLQTVSQRWQLFFNKGGADDDEPNGKFDANSHKAPNPSFSSPSIGVILYQMALRVPENR